MQPQDHITTRKTPLMLISCPENELALTQTDADLIQDLCPNTGNIDFDGDYRVIGYVGIY